MKKYLLILGIISLFMIAACAQQQPEQPTVKQEELAQDETITKEETNEVSHSRGSVEIDMIAKQWEFDPATITVKKGNKVKLNIKSIDVAHGIAIPEFGVSQYLEPNKEVTVEFIADKTGEFMFFCSVSCGRGHGGMIGKLVVE